MSSSLTPSAAIASGQTCVGLELGSSRIKTMLIGLDHTVLASGVADWENQLVGGLWTYSLEQVWTGIAAAWENLQRDVQQRHGQPLTTTGQLGISAMMHGYLAFDAAGQLLTPFRTWRNTNTSRAAAELSATFGVNIPLRWSVAHLYQAVLDQEEHVPEIAYLCTLAGYVHWQLTGQKVLGIDDASGMFPVVGTPPGFNSELMERFDQLPAVLPLPWTLPKIMPQVLVAGQAAGQLNAQGAAKLDPTGQLKPGAGCCPPEGDAGTGMVATGTVGLGSGNVSVGTSIFAMVVTDQTPPEPLPEIDMVATPDGLPVAMVHCNNGASELGDWAALLTQFAEYLGAATTPDQVFATLLQAALDGQADAGGYLAYNYLAGEPITGTTVGWPLVARRSGQPANLADFARAQVYGVYATLRLGMDLLAGQGIKPDNLLAHGGLFKTPVVAQRFLAAALNVPVTVGQAAGDGGAWGMAVLAAYQLATGGNQPLPDYLSQQVFQTADFTTLEPDPTDVAGFESHLAHYRAGLAMERAIGQIASD